MKIISFILSLCICVNLIGQDIHFSQFNDLPLALNPALSGKMDGTLRAGTIYRNQWNSVGIPFESSGLYADFKASPKFLRGQNIGLGVQLLNDRSGSGALNENVFSFSGSYHHFLTEKEDHLVTGGISIGGFQKSIDLSELNFQNQFLIETANFGTMSSNENLESNYLLRMDLAMGGSWTYFNPYGYHFSAGISVFHLSRPNTSFYGKEDALARKVNIHANGVYPINQRFDLDPSFLISTQNKNSNIVIGADLLYDLGRKTVEKIDLKVGCYARLGDALNFTIGMNHDNWSIDLGYDLNVSGLTKATKSRGAFEISISFVNRMYKGAKNIKYVIPGNRLL